MLPNIYRSRIFPSFETDLECQKQNKSSQIWMLESTFGALCLNDKAQGPWILNENSPYEVQRRTFNYLSQASMMNLIGCNGKMYEESD
jgi:hypothetical protein